MTTIATRGRLTRADLDAMRAAGRDDGRRYELLDGSIIISPDAGSWLTRADLDAMPDDGRRHELLDGSIIVTPSPGFEHQTVVTAVWRLLDDAAPSDQRALVAPFDVALATGAVVQPDVVVATTAFLTGGAEGVPALVVEVLSPSTRRRDLGDKLTTYRDAGVLAYWVIDPLTPRLRVWQLTDGDYAEIADVAADEQWTATTPYAVTIRPRDLLR